MENSTVLCEVNQSIATIILNNPVSHNAFNDEMIIRLIDCFTQYEKDESIRLIQLKANGKNFSAGADLNWMKRMANFSEQENYADSMQLAKLMKTIYCCKKPTMALVQGAVYGGGVGLIACADIVIASDNAHFCFSEARLGLIPAVISPYVMKVIGEKAARRYFLTAEKINVQTAYKLGLVSEIVNEDEAATVIESISKKIINNGPQAILKIKELVDLVSNSAFNDSLIEETAKRIADVRTSKEGQEGINAFFNKRKPEWIN